ncbi:MAG: MFS transporter, partial [Treponema sp.]|nr:MFS transporter [Treponema sp.]
MASIFLLIIIYLSFIGLGLPDSVLGPSWPSMYGPLNVPLHYAGIISMIATSCSVISCIFCEKVIKRLGTGLVSLISIFMTAAAFMCISLSNSFMFLCFLAVPLGLGAGAVDASLNNYIALHYKARHMSWLHCFWGIGASFGPILIASLLLKGNSWHTGYRTISFILFGIVVFLIISLPLWKKNIPEEGVKKETVKFRNLFSIPGVKEALASFFCYCTIELTTGLWGASFLVMEKGIAPEIAARWISLYYIGITAGRFISGFITMKLSNRQMIRMGQIIIAAGVISLFLPFGNGALLPGFFLIGLGCAPVFPSMLHETPQNFGMENSQAVIGLQMGCAYIGSTIMPPVFGWLASFMSFGIFPVFIGIILAVKIILVESLNRKTGI